MMYKIKLMTKGEINIRELKTFIGLVNQDFPVPLTEKIDIDNFLKKINDYGNVFCAYDGRKLIGCSFFYANDEKREIAFLTLLAVLKEYRNLGVGEQLVSTMLEFCQNLSFSKLQLYTHKNNINARKFYIKKGFYEIYCDRPNDIKLEINLAGGDI